MRIRSFRLLCVAITLIGSVAAEATAQVSGLPAPPNSVRLLVSQSEEWLAHDDFGNAVDALQQVLDLDQDYFDPRATGRSIKRHAERSLRLLPAEGRQAYERRYGPQATSLLNQARQSGDDALLDEVIRRYGMTRAGADAVALLADSLWDSGDVLAAGRLFDRLLDHPAVDDTDRAAALSRAAVCWWGCGNTARARDRLAAWLRLVSNSAEHAPGAFPDPAMDTDAALTWLAQRSPQLAVLPRATGERIVGFRNDPQRSGVYDQATPTGGVVWNYPAVDEDDSGIPGRIGEISKSIGELQQEVRDKAGEDQPILPAGCPVICDDRMIFRGYGTLKWLDPDSGGPIYYSSIRDETFASLVDQGWHPEEPWHPENVRLFFGQRAWRDLTSDALSCDDRYVYSIFNSGIASAMGSTVESIAELAPHPLSPRPYNLLAAFEVDLCRAIWEQGGPPRAVAGHHITGVYFLGAPLPLDGLLYCLVDDRKQVRLVVLDPAIDPDREEQVVWEQPLYNAEYHLSDPAAVSRRLAGLTPSASGDVLVCPTGESMVVAVDRRTRQLLWTHQYREVSIDPRMMQIRMLMAQRRAVEPAQEILDDLLEDDHWSDSAPIISGEYVLYTPPDDDDLLCLRLTDGHLLWQEDRRDGLYVAGVYDGNAIIVGSSRIRAIRLEDGKPAWPESIPIPAPSGRGFQHDRYYVLPLSSREVASIDLADGRILTRSPTGDWTPGNLFSARGRIYSQTAAEVAAFASLEDQNRNIEERLAMDPDDAEALALRGEQRLHLGDVSGGITDLRHSLSMMDNSRVRALLASTLIEGLRVDFAAYRDAADEINDLVRDPSERAMFLRLLADGLQDSGDTVAAFRAYLGFAGENITEPVRDGDGDKRLVRPDRWILGRLSDLYSQADDSVEEELDELMAATTASAVQAGDVDQLRDLSVMLPSAVNTQRLRLALVDHLDQEHNASEMELQLLRLHGSEDRDVRSGATARLLKLYLDEGQTNPVPTLTAQLAGPFADEVCLDGLTGAELLADWEGDAKRQAVLHPPPVWPLGHIEIDDNQRRSRPQYYAIEHLGPMSGILRGWNFFLDPNRNQLRAFDEQGASRWDVPIGQSGRGNQAGSGDVRCVRTLGRLVLLVTNDEFFVIDALAEQEQPRILVSDQLFRPEDDQANTFIQIRIGGARRNALGGGLRNQFRTNRVDGRVNGNVGPLLAGGLVYQQGSTIRAVDPLTGNEFWQRESPEVPAGAEIMADDEFVVLWPRDRDTVIVLRAADGSRVGPALLPRGVLNPQPDGDWGRCVVFEEDEREGAVVSKRLALFDPVSQEFRWERRFPDLLEWTVVDGRDFAVLREGGRFTLIDGRTGQERFETQLEDEIARTMFVERLDDQVLVMTASTPPDDKQIQPWQELDFPIVHGQVTLFNLDDGQAVWSRRVEHQMYVRHLPGRWPLLAFAANISEPKTRETYTSVLLLNRATGEVLHEGDWRQPVTKLGWLSVPEQHRLELTFSFVSLSLTFHPEADESDADESKSNDPTNQ